MQSVVLYGRLVARALVTGISDRQHTNPFHSQAQAHSQTQLVRPLTLITACSGISKTKTGSHTNNLGFYGDDACFTAKTKTVDVLGVADGVGGWREYGVDPSKMPKFLMETCHRIVKEGKFIAQDPKEILSSSYRELLESKIPMIGSCTACLVALDKEERKLHTANLGDSGFLLIRGNNVIEASEDQQHYFNTPYQLTVAPSALEGTVLSDSPDSADSSSIDIQEGDIILVGTDGLFDNVDLSTIVKHCRTLKKQHKVEQVQQVADTLVDQAHKLAFDPEYMSPFAKNAVANGYNVKGGKPDDITVVLGLVTDGDPILT